MRVMLAQKLISSRFLCEALKIQEILGVDKDLILYSWQWSFPDIISVTC
jgi:hypothetical protein